MATHRCLWCGDLYLPKEGAVRSYYCRRSCKEKYYRFSKKCKATEAKFLEQYGNLDSLKKLIWSAHTPTERSETISDIMQYVDPRAHLIVIRLLRKFHEQAYQGEQLPW